MLRPFAPQARWHPNKGSSLVIVANGTLVDNNKSFPENEQLHTSCFVRRRCWFLQGSFRDCMRGGDPQAEFADKYRRPGKPFATQDVRAGNC